MMLDMLLMQVRLKELGWLPEETFETGIKKQLIGICRTTKND